MALVTSDKFASAYAKGTDWRDVARKILSMLEDVRTGEGDFQFGIIYMTEDLVPHAQNIIDLFKSVTQIENWVGASGVGICTSHEEIIDEPAIVAMIGHMDSSAFQLIHPVGGDNDRAEISDQSWWSDNDAIMTLLHLSCSGYAEKVSMLERLGQQVGSFLVGGVSSLREAACHVSNDICDTGMSGISFSHDVKLSVMISQGCRPLGPVHTVTKSRGLMIEAIDGASAFDIFSLDVTERAQQDTERFQKGELSEDDMQGEIHIGLIRKGGDQRDYLVRNIVGIDEDSGLIMTSQPINEGDEIVFVHRDHNSVTADLSKDLLAFRQRLANENEHFKPRGAIYISSASRSMSGFGGAPGDEAQLIQEIIGPVPLAGFYSDGEISGGAIHGYTGLLIVFL